MIDEEHLTGLKLWEQPFGQKVVASIFLGPNYSLPPVTRIVLEGVAAIQKGLHPKVAKEFLLSFLGEESYTIFEKEFDGRNRNTLEMYLQKLEDNTTAKESRLDNIILKLNNDEIEKFLMEINTGDLAKALKSLGGKAQIRLFNNLSQKAASALVDVLDDLESMEESEMKDARDIALDILSDLDLNA